MEICCVCHEGFYVLILTDIAAYLIARGLAPADNNTAPAGTYLLYQGYMPDDSETTMAIFETPGGKPALTLDRLVCEVTFQLRVRGARLNYPGVRAQWQACYNALQDSQPTSAYALVQSYNYGPMTFNDDRGRPNFITNFRAILLTSAADS